MTITGLPQDVPPQADHLAALRALGPLVSHVDDRRLIEVGHHVVEASPGGTTYTPRGGVVVERWVDVEGEAGVVAIAFLTVKRKVQVVVHRLLVERLRDEVLPTPYRPECAWAARMLLTSVGQRVRPSGAAEMPDETERRHICWALALLAAAGGALPVHPHLSATPHRGEPVMNPDELRDIREVQTTQLAQEANLLLDRGWVLIGVTLSAAVPMFVLGRREVEEA